jgi:cytochrome c biogenesis protein CcmG/thiol:disulfide interchange protein DsbE
MPRMRFRFPPPAVTLALALVAAGCSAGPSREPASRASGAATTSARVGPAGARGEASVTPASPEELSRLVRAGGAPVTLVNVWATWCNPCREEMPALLAVARRHPEMRLLLVSADFTDQRPAAAAFLAERGVSGTTYLKSGSDQEFIDALNRGWTGSLPATFVYDASGHEVAFWEGMADERRFEAAITQALQSKP